MSATTAANPATSRLAVMKKAIAPVGRAGRRRAQLVAEEHAQNAAEHQHPEEQEDTQRAPVEVGAAAGKAARAGFTFHRRQGLAADQRADLVHRGAEATGKVVLPKARLHRGVDDARGHDVGDRALQRLGDLDAHLALVLGDDHQHAVAHRLAPDLPGIADAVGVAGDVLRRGAGHHQHHHLRALLGLDGGELGFQRLLLLDVQGGGLVDHPRRELRHRREALRQRRGRHQHGHRKDGKRA